MFLAQGVLGGKDTERLIELKAIVLSIPINLSTFGQVQNKYGHFGSIINLSVCTN